MTIKPLEIRNGAERVLNNVVVAGGERADLSYNFTSGTLSIGTRRGDVLVDSVIAVIDESGKNIGGGRTYTSESSNPKQIIVAPGTYTVRIAEIRGDKRETTAQVAVGETKEILVNLDRPE